MFCGGIFSELPPKANLSGTEFIFNLLNDQNRIVVNDECSIYNASRIGGIPLEVQHTDDRPGHAGGQSSRHDRLETQCDDLWASLRRHHPQTADHDSQGPKIGESAHGVKHDHVGAGRQGARG